jgi:hypothetical protein
LFVQVSDEEILEAIQDRFLERDPFNADIYDWEFVGIRERTTLLTPDPIHGMLGERIYVHIRGADPVTGIFRDMYLSVNYITEIGEFGNIKFSQDDVENE